MNTIQNVEIWENSTQRYINVHKSGSTTIRSCLKQTYTDIKIAVDPGVYSDQSSITWTTLRDPYDRFINALSYDLGLVGMDVSENNIKQVAGTDKLLRDYIYGLSNPYYRGRGTIRYSMLQSSYLFDNRLDVYVDIKDLNIFCAMHFPEVELPPEGLNTGVKKNIDIVHKFFQENPMLNNSVYNLLYLDRFTMHRLDALDKRWHWANGVIF